MPAYYVEYDDTFEQNLIFQGRVRSEAEKVAIFQIATKLHDLTFSDLNLINHILVVEPMVEINVDFVRISAKKGEQIGFNVLGANGVSVVNTATFDIAKAFFPHVGAATAGLTSSNSTLTSNLHLNADVSDQRIQTIASPFLTTKSGTEAKFQQGGEVGVKISALAGGNCGLPPLRRHFESDTGYFWHE